MASYDLERLAGRLDDSNKPEHSSPEPDDIGEHLLSRPVLEPRHKPYHPTGLQDPKLAISTNSPLWDEAARAAGMMFLNRLADGPSRESSPPSQRK